MIGKIHKKLPLHVGLPAQVPSLAQSREPVELEAVYPTRQTRLYGVPWGLADVGVELTSEFAIETSVQVFTVKQINNSGDVSYERCCSFSRNICYRGSPFLHTLLPNCPFVQIQTVEL